MKAGRVRWGVISTANIGRAAVNPAIQASSNGQLDAVASRDMERAKAFADTHGIPRAYGSYEALLEDPEIDAIYIPLPNSLHYAWSVRAAGAGKHVLCEKPLALDAAECREMAHAAEEAGVKLMEAFMYRFHPRIARAQALLAEGAVGSVSTIRSAFTFRLTNPTNIRLDPELGGGALMDVGCYCVNATRTFAAAEPIEVQAVAHQSASGVDDHLVGVLRFDSGLVGHFDCALTLERREVVEISGTDGTLVLEDAFLPGKGDVAISELRGRAGRKEHAVAGADEYQRMVEHFAECVLEDRPVRYSPGEAAANMAVIEALYRSAGEGGRPARV